MTLPGRFFQFFARPGNVGNYGFNFSLVHPISLWKVKNDEKWHFESLVPGPKFSGPKYSLSRNYFQAEVYKWAEVFPGRSCFGPKYFWAKVFRAEVFWAEVFPGRSECRAKAVSGPNWGGAFKCFRGFSSNSLQIIAEVRLWRIILDYRKVASSGKPWLVASISWLVAPPKRSKI